MPPTRQRTRVRPLALEGPMISVAQPSAEAITTRLREAYPKIDARAEPDHVIIVLENGDRLRIDCGSVIRIRGYREHQGLPEVVSAKDTIIEDLFWFCVASASVAHDRAREAHRRELAFKHLIISVTP